MEISALFHNFEGTCLQYLQSLRNPLVLQDDLPLLAKANHHQSFGQFYPEFSLKIELFLY